MMRRWIPAAVAALLLAAAAPAKAGYLFSFQSTAAQPGFEYSPLDALSALLTVDGGVVTAASGASVVHGVITGVLVPGSEFLAGTGDFFDAPPHLTDGGFGLQMGDGWKMLLRYDSASGQYTQNACPPVPGECYATVGTVIIGVADTFVPEPASLGLLTAGVLGLVAVRRRQAARAA